MDVEQPKRCQKTICVRDTYRRTGRTPSGFELHYNEQQCSRRATRGDFCYQHSPDTREERWARQMAAMAMRRRMRHAELQAKLKR